MSFNFSYRNIHDNIELNIYTCGFEACKSKHSYGPAVRSGYLIHIVTSGKGFYKLNNKIYTLKIGDCFLIEPNNLIYYEADEKDPWEYIWVGFIGTKVKDYLNNTSLSNLNPVFTLSENSNLISSINSIIAASKINSNKNLIILSKLYDFFYNLLEEFPNNSERKKEIQKIYLEEAIEYIQLNYQDNISVNNISKHLSINRSYFHRIFKKYTNMSPQEYILKLKIEKACELLVTTNLKIGDISRSVGYIDTLLFSKTFKKSKGYTPSDFRKLNL
ncbi:AraC family transcriptional regulator [Clostridium butyricum]|uniref:AraC family transcriptional regulator n=1 Tax=Clostridium butyricum TaxID=1492 RepID=UPI00374F1705